MAKISLRMYNREIEGLVEQGQHLDEAIAHCRHILQTYPKHLETYRLLGKAYLEAKRYDQAVDIFQRVLVAAPDDFVSHVGMSIIADDKGKLDGAIWHMERAFEVQPSNAAIQGELQRLFGRRDGVEPPKIRLTRGALAHMYVQGELYTQAISEIRAVLSNDPRRMDMQTLLARAYFRNGQKTEAAGICNELLGKYPYCLDANRLMVEIAPGTQRAEAAQEYRQRVIELDPYAAFATGSLFQADNVSDNAVMIERLEYTGSTAEMPPSLGIGLETDATAMSRAAGAAPSTPPADQPSGDLPAWLRTGVEAPNPPAPAATSSVPDKNDIPDFLRQAGWGASAGQAEEQAAPFEEQPAETSDAAVEGDLPDWVKALAPTAEDTMPSKPVDDAFQADTPDWLRGLGDQAMQPEASQPGSGLSASNAPSLPADAPDWLRGLGEPESTQPVASQPESGLPVSTTPSLSADAPDWLLGLGDQASTQPEPSQPESGSPASTTPSLSADAPDWLLGLDDQAATQPQPSQPESGFPATNTPSLPADAPDWLLGLGDQASTQPEPSQPESGLPASNTPSLSADAPDWLNELGPVPTGSAAPAPVPADDTPDWLKGLTGRELDEPAIHESQDDWLGSLRAEQPAAAAPSEPEQAADETPDWLKNFSNDLETPIMKTAPQEPATPPPAPAAPATPEVPAALGSLGTTAQEQDDAMAWLESLAAKHGAKAEELVTDPNARTDVAPEWVDKAKEIGERATEPTPPVNEDQTGMWLRNLAADAEKPQEPQPPVEQPKEESLDFRESFAGQGDFTATPEPANEESPIMGSTETPDWLRDLTETPSAPPAKEDAPSWLRGITEEQPKAQLPEQPAEPEQSTAAFETLAADTSAADLPAWLAGLDKEDQAMTPPAGGKRSMEQLPSWLQSEAEPEPEAKEPANPADWRPVAPVETEPPVVEQKPEPVAEQPPVWPAPAPVAAPVETPPVPAPEPQRVEAAPEPMPAPRAESPLESVPAPQQVENALEPVPAPQQVESAPEPVPAPRAVSPVDSMPTPQQVENAPEAVPTPQYAEKAPEPMPAARVETLPVDAPALERVEKAPEPVRPASKPRPAPAAASKLAVVSLVDAQSQLGRGNIAAALDLYTKLIRKGKSLDDIIRDLRDALYRYPVEVPLWQSLGDAYMRANRLQEALDAYTKAEELLR